MLIRSVIFFYLVLVIIKLINTNLPNDGDADTFMITRAALQGWKGVFINKFL